MVATARNPDESSELQELKRNFDENRLIVAPLDVQKPDQFVALKDFLSQRGMNSIDILIGNAGISTTTHPHNPFLECTPDDMREVYETNVIGNMLLLQTFHEFLIRGDSKIAAIMSSSLGSYTNAAEKSEGTTVAYRCSKAALNMLSILYASEPSAHEAGVKLIILHPGWVKTEMGQTGGQKTKIDIEESTDGMLDILERAVQFQASQSAVGKTGGDEKATKTANKYRFRSPPDELENMEHLNEFVSHLDNNNFAFVRHDGFILQW